MLQEYIDKITSFFSTISVSGMTESMPEDGGVWLALILGGVILYFVLQTAAQFIKVILIVAVVIIFIGLMFPDYQIMDSLQGLFEKLTPVVEEAVKKAEETV